MLYKDQNVQVYVSVLYLRENVLTLYREEDVVTNGVVDIMKL